MILFPVPRESLSDWWPVVLPFAEIMAKRFPDDWPTEETLRQARDTLALWLALEPEERTAYAAAGTKIIRKPSGKTVLVIRWCAGRQVDRWAHLLRGFEDYGRENGCTAIEIEPGSRAGWKRAFPDYRARPSVMLTKEL